MLRSPGMTGGHYICGLFVRLSVHPSHFTGITLHAAPSKC